MSVCRKREKWICCPESVFLVRRPKWRCSCPFYVTKASKSRRFGAAPLKKQRSQQKSWAYHFIRIALTMCCWKKMLIWYLLLVHRIYIHKFRRRRWASASMWCATNRWGWAKQMPWKWCAVHNIIRRWFHWSIIRWDFCPPLCTWNGYWTRST